MDWNSIVNSRHGMTFSLKAPSKFSRPPLNEFGWNLLLKCYPKVKGFLVSNKLIKSSIINSLIIASSIVLGLILSDFLAVKYFIPDADKIKTFDDYSKKAPFYKVNGKLTSDITRYQEDDELHFKLKSNYHEELEVNFFKYSFNFQTNSDGFRERNFDSLPKESKKILLIGDSVTFGHGVNQNEAFPQQLQKILPNDWISLNLGVGGWGPSQYYLTAKKYIKELKPEIVVLSFYSANDFNDIKYTEWDGKDKGVLPESVRRSYYYIDNKTNLRRSDSSYRYPILRNSRLYIWLNDRYQNKKYSPASPMPDHDIKMASLFINDLVKNNKETKFLIQIFPRHCCAQMTYIIEEDILTISYKDRFLEGINDVENIYIYDHFETLFAKPNLDDLYVDSAHFSAKGNLKVASIILDTFKELHWLNTN